jgi:hypothetical protein
VEEIMPDKAGESDLNLESRETAHKEQLRLAYSTLMEEYKVIYNLIGQHLTYQQSTISLTLTLIAALLAGAKFIIDARLPFLFAVSSWVFIGIIWTQLRYQIAVNALGDHVVKHIQPPVTNVVRRISPDTLDRLPELLSFEQYGRAQVFQPVILNLPILAARYIIPFVAALVSFGAYLELSKVTRGSHKYSLSILCCVEVLLVLYTVAVVIWVGLNSLRGANNTGRSQ